MQNGVRLLQARPQGLSPRFIPVFYVIAVFHPEGLRDRLLYQAGVWGEPFVTLCRLYGMGLERPSNRPAMREPSFGSDVPYASCHIDEPYTWGLTWAFPIVVMPGSMSPFFPFAEDLVYYRQEVPGADPADLVKGLSSRNSERPSYVFAYIPSPGILSHLERPAKWNPPRSPAEGARHAVSDDEEERQHNREAAVFSSLAWHRNPVPDTYLVEWLDIVRAGGFLVAKAMASLLQALVVTDTPATRDALMKAWNENTPEFTTDEDPIRNVCPPPAAPRGHRQAATKRLRPAAMARTDRRAPRPRPASRRCTPPSTTSTPPAAFALLEKWANDPNPYLANAANEQVKREQRELDQARQLLEGTLEPDALR